jgi:hypothetical protein
MTTSLKDCLQEALQLEGTLGVALGDWKSGMCLGYTGVNSPEFPIASLETAVAFNTEVVRAKMKALQALKLEGKLEDMLMTITNQYHLIRMTQAIDGLFFYLVMDREKSNLALARIKLSQIEKKLSL